MVSFAHPGQVQAAAEICQSFTLDNGAFSVWKTGKALDLDALAEWVGLWVRHPGCDWYCIPDAIGEDHNANSKMRSCWANKVSGRVWDRGVPIWHLHEPIEVLREFLDWPVGRVAIGSSGQFSDIGTPQWWARMAEAMEILCDQDGMPKVRIHGLRMLDPTIFSHFPFSSADSTNVARNVGIDSRWSGPYAPRSRKVRALIMMDRIESHASAWRWCKSAGKNEELFG